MPLPGRGCLLEQRSVSLCAQGRGIVSCLLLVCRALWAGLREDYGQALPEGLSLRLVYEDGEGDFVMLQPDEPWATFLSSARRVIISCQ